MNVFSKVFAFLLLMVMPTLLVASETKQAELSFLTWSDYIDPAVVEKFEQQFKARIRMVYYDSDDQRDDILVETDGKGYDVILCSDPSLEYYKKRRWLAPISAKQVPNLKYVYSRWIDSIVGAKGYAVPYFWGTLGIAYRKDLIDFEVTSWKQLFEPAPVLQKKIIMLDGANDVISMALKSLGYSANSIDKNQIKQAKNLLLKQKPHVHSYYVTDLSEDAPLVKGEVYMSMAYSGDTLMLQEHEPEIKYVLPEEGGNIWIDYLVVGMESKNKKLAYDFINFLNQPEIAAQLAQYVYYPSPNRAAEKLLPKEFLEDPVIYPSKQALEKSEVYKKSPPRIQKLKNSIYNSIIH